MTREELNDKVEELEAKVIELTGSLETAAKASEDGVAAFAALTESLKEEQENRIAAETELAEVSRVNADMEKQVAEITADRDKLKDALANPAMIDAAMLPSKAKPSISDAEADDLDVKAKAAAEDETPSLWDAYNSLEGADKTAFWKANKEAMQAELKTNATK